MERKEMIDIVINILEQYGCPKDKSEQCAIGLIVESGYKIRKKQNKKNEK